ncbi:hypothetical protein Tco_0462966 [Tanacetum coccineum]
MADENVPTPAPIRFDDQILPFVAWVPIGKSNYVLDLQKKQKNPIFQISMDILQNINFRAFNASASRESLEITLIDQAHQFVSPQSGDAIMDFVNELGYTEVIHFMSRMAVNNMYQPWRLILSMINQCLTGKTSGHDRPRYPVLQMLWGIITIPLRRAGKTSLTRPQTWNAPYYNMYLEMVAKHDQKVVAEKQGKRITVSAKQPKPKPAIEKSSKLTPAPKLKVTKKKPSKASTAKPPKPKPAKEKSTKATPLQKAGKGEGDEYDVKRAIQMSLESFQTQSQAHVGGVAIQEPTPATEKASTRPFAQPQDDISANIVRDSPSPADAETCVESDKTNSGGDTEILQITEKLGEDVDTQVNLEEKTVKLNQDQAGSYPGETHESRPPPEQVFMDEDQAGPKPEKSSVALAGPDLDPMHDEFMANLYPKLKDLPHKIDEIVRENVKEAVQIALQAPLRDHFKDLSEEDMKEILYQRMFESGTYKSLSEHVALYEALEASMARAQRDEFLAKKAKSRKRRLDDQDPPPPPPDSDLNKKKRHDSDASGSLQPLVPQSSAWKKSYTRDTPSSSSKQQSGHHSKQPVEDIPMPDTAHISDSEDTDSAHLPKIKPRP